MTGLEIAGLMGASGSVGSGLVNSIMSGIYSQKNLDFAKDQFNYQKQLNSQYLDRMDNRLSYLKKDAQNAGVNLLSALGQGGGYSPLQAGTAPKQDIPIMQELGSALGNLTQVASTMQSIKTAKSVENLNTAKAKTELSTALLNNQLMLKHKQDLSYAYKHDLPTAILPTFSQEIKRDLKNLIIDDNTGFGGAMNKLSDFNDKYKTYSEINKTDWSKRLDNWFFGLLDKLDKKLKN